MSSVMSSVMVGTAVVSTWTRYVSVNSTRCAVPGMPTSRAGSKRSCPYNDQCD
jgi:hypothetical protein